MPYLWWSVTVILMIVGLLGTMLPILPGSTIILAAAILHHFTISGPHTVGWWTIAALAVLTIISYLVDLVSGTVGAKWFGATKWGAIGGIVGMIVGLFFGLLGMFVGPLVGVFLGEIIGGKQLLPATKSTWGTLLGTTAGLIARFFIGLIQVAWFALAAWR
jgi:uncharacterized protein YqgC (DUF456 family)